MRSKIILRDIDVNSHITGDKLGRCLEADDDALDRYADFLKSTLDVDIKGRKLVLDCANGAAYRIAEKVYSELGADITVIGNVSVMNRMVSTSMTPVVRPTLRNCRKK